MKALILTIMTVTSVLMLGLAMTGFQNETSILNIIELITGSIIMYITMNIVINNYLKD